MSDCITANGLSGISQRGMRVRVDVANLTLKEAVFLEGMIDLLTDPVNWPVRDLLESGNLTITVDHHGIQTGATYLGN